MSQLCRLLITLLMGSLVAPLQFAVPFLQSGSVDGGSPLHELGLKGQGETIAVIDTGLDYFHCAFNDNGKLLKTTGRVEAHNKITYYNNRYAELHHNDTKENSHGTSMAGAAAGGYCQRDPTPNPGGFRSPPIEYNHHGMAPLSKVAFFGTTRGQSFDLPTNLHQVLSNLYDEGGARSFVMAFCGGDPLRLVPQMNTFSYKHPDAILVGAAGNNGVRACNKSHPGFSGSCGFGSVCYPHVAKNTLTVGGIQSMDKSRAVIGYPDQYIKVTCDSDEERHVVALRAQFSPDPIKEVVDKSKIEFHGGGEFGCRKRGLLEKVTTPPQVVFARRGTCPFTEKVANADSEVKLVIVSNDNDRLDGPMECLDDDHTIYKPAVLIPKRDGDYIFENIQKGKKCLVSGVFDATSSNKDVYWSEQNLLTMSGRGSSDRKVFPRTKPDVVAPGEYILLPKANTTNGLLPHTGSSPATALVAGAALLVREAFLKGKLPLNSDTESNLRYLSSATVRAALVHTTVKLRGFADATGFGDWRRLPSEPEADPFQGYGRPILKDIFNGVVIYQNSDKAAPETTLCYKPVSNSISTKATVTISWNDPYPHTLQDVRVSARMVGGDDLNSPSYDFFDKRVSSLEKIEFNLPDATSITSVLRISVSQKRPRTKGDHTFPNELPFSLLFSNKGAQWNSVSHHRSCRPVFPAQIKKLRTSGSKGRKVDGYPSAWGWYGAVVIFMGAYTMSRRRYVDKKNS